VTLNFFSARSLGGTLIVISLVGPGCSSKPAAEKPAASPPAPPAAAAPVQAKEEQAAAPVDSPAFATPEEAVQAWAQAYREEGEDGHRRVTFDQSSLPDEQWQKTLAQGYEAAAKAGEVQVLETLSQGQVAAVIVRLGERVDRFALYRDAKGWHLSRTLRDWDAVKMPAEYRGVVKDAFNLGADASVSEIEWRKKLNLE
jgi:hypothetical protein